MSQKSVGQKPDLPQDFQDKYTNLKLLNQTEMITTYLAEAKGSKRSKKKASRYIIKHLSFARIEAWKARELFDRETRLLKNLSHPAVPEYENAYQDAETGDAWLVLKYIPGQSLQEWVDQGRVFSTAEVLSIGRKICEVLHDLHSLNPPLIHRDIKPSNIILDPDDNIFVIDFGAIKEGLSHLMQDTMGSTFIGTAGYMPLEQLYRKAYPASDIYALGATLLFLKTGKAPHDFEKKQLRLQFKAALQGEKNLILLFEKMLEPHIEKRYPNAQTVLEGLNQLIKLTAGQSSNNPLRQLFQRSGLRKQPGNAVLFSFWLGALFSYTSMWLWPPLTAEAIGMVLIPLLLILLLPIGLWTYFYLPKRKYFDFPFSAVIFTLALSGLLSGFLNYDSKGGDFILFCLLFTFVGGVASWIVLEA